MICQMPSINDNEIKTIFDGIESIAIVGMSPDITKDSYRVGFYLSQQGYNVIAIYPKGNTIGNIKIYHTLEDVDIPIDMVVVFRKPEALMDVTNDVLKHHNIKILWFQRGLVNNEAAIKGQDHGLRVVQNRCAMVEHQKLKESYK